MSLIRWQKPVINVWSPFRQLAQLREEIDHLFEPSLAGFTSASQPLYQGWLPALDLYEDQDQFVLKAELPGMKREDIGISLHDGVLTLSGERQEEKNLEKAETYRSERFLGKFQRSLSLPGPVDSAKVQACYKDGILAVNLPKAEHAKPKQIEVKVN